MKFSEVIGQETAKGILRGVVQHERMPHALLLLSPRGAGGLSLALAYVQYVLCENRQGDEACGTCKHCHKTAKFIHPDVHFSYPTVGTKVVASDVLEAWREALHRNPYLNASEWFEALGAEGKLGNIPVDETNRIIRVLSLTKFEGNHKILIMWLPEYLGKEGNRLLKLIEEPPDDTLFILVAENQELILPTILSRCQLIKLKPLSDETVAEALQQKMRHIADAEALAIAHLADGDFNAALHIATEAENDNAQAFLEWMRLSYKGNSAELVAWVDKFATIGRDRQKLFFQYGLHFLHEIMMLLATQNTDLRLRASEKQTALNMQKVLSLGKIEQASQLFDETSYYIERNANPKVLFLNTSIKMSKIFRMTI